MKLKYFGHIFIFTFISFVHSQFLNNAIIAYVGDEHVINCNLAKEDNKSIEDDAYWKKDNILFKYSTHQSGDYIILIESRNSFSEDLEVRAFQLLFKNVLKADSGIYTCFYNGLNRTTVTLHVIDKPNHEIIISNSGITDNLSTRAPLYTNFSLNINVTDCCVAENVSEECRSSCVGQLGMKESCRPFVDKIDMCIINGKDHTSCCRRRLVPDNCIDLCTHALSDAALANMCASHFPEILQCIEEGHYSLPSAPRYVAAQTLNGTSLRLTWSPPASNPALVTEYTIVYARLELPAPSAYETRGKLQSFLSTQSLNLSTDNTSHPVYSVAHDPNSVVLGISYDSLDSAPRMILPARNELRVVTGGGQVSHVLINLTPGSAYEIYMQAHSVYGSSLPSDIVEVFTQSQDAPAADILEPSPKIPSPQKPKPPAMTHGAITKCCADANIPDECLSLLCQMHNLASNTSHALVLCARHYETAMKCIIDGRNHTSCCIKNRISPWCYGFCDGTSHLVTDAREANCLIETAQIITCIIQGHEILPSEPRNLKSLFTTEHSVTLAWDASDRNKDMITSYGIYYKEGSPYETPGDRDYTFFTQVSNVTGTTYQLGDLHPETWYEIFVVADALNGSSLPSGSIKFLTRPARIGLTPPGPPPTLAPSTGVANATTPDQSQASKATACCDARHVDTGCLPLCAYDVKADVAADLLPRCPSHLQSVLSCLADERDHSICCENRNVPASCLPFCRAQLPSDLQQAINCIGHSFQILECFETGIKTLPSPPLHLYLTNRSRDTLTVTWDAPLINPFNLTYKITYATDYHKLPAVSTSNLTYTLTNLLPNTTYHILVEAVNSYGSSLPTYLVLATTLPLPKRGPITSKAKIPYGTTTPGPDGSRGDEGGAMPPRPIETEVLAVGTEYLTLAWKVVRVAPGRKKDWIYRVYYTQLPPPLINNGSEGTVPPLVTAPPSYHSINVTEARINLTNLEPDRRYKIFITSESAEYESLPSETIIVRAAQHASPQASIVVIPVNPVEAGKTVTMRCLTTGIPAPQVSWYHWLDNFQQPIWHEENLTMNHLHRTAMGQYKCVARNGILPNGKDFVHLKVAFTPLVMAKNGPVFTSRFATIRLNCSVEAYPPIIPKSAVWYKDGQLMTKGDLASSHQSSLYHDDSSGNKYTYVMTLVVKNVQPRHFGSYVCQAGNKYGTDKDTIEVRQRDFFDPLKPLPIRNVSECCERLNVKEDCLPACFYDDNLEGLLQSNHNRLLQCLPELSKIVHCSADGRDHSICCDKRNVPGQCRRFCQGKVPPLSTPYMDSCIGYAKTIIDCFYSGSEIIPTVPTNVTAQTVHGNAIKLKWKAPDKYANKVKFYTVYYRSAKDTDWKMKRVTAPSTRFADLDQDTQYYFQVMAGNGHGSSQKSSIISLYTGSEEPMYRKVHKESKPATMALGFIGATLLASVLGLALYILYKKRFSHLNHPVSFDNPGYEKEHVLDDMNPSPFSNGPFGGTLDLGTGSYGRASPVKGSSYGYGGGNHGNGNNNRRPPSSCGGGLGGVGGAATSHHKPGPDDPLNGISGWHLPSLHASSSPPSSSPPSSPMGGSGRTGELLPSLGGSSAPPSTATSFAHDTHPERSAILSPDDFDDDDDGAAILNTSSLSPPSYVTRGGTSGTRRERMIA